MGMGLSLGPVGRHRRDRHADASHGSPIWGFAMVAPWLTRLGMRLGSPCATLVRRARLTGPLQMFMRGASRATRLGGSYGCPDGYSYGLVYGRPRWAGGRSAGDGTVDLVRGVGSSGVAPAEVDAGGESRPSEQASSESFGHGFLHVVRVGEHRPWSGRARCPPDHAAPTRGESRGLCSHPSSTGLEAPLE